MTILDFHDDYKLVFSLPSGLKTVKIDNLADEAWIELSNSGTSLSVETLEPADISNSPAPQSMKCPETYSQKVEVVSSGSSAVLCLYEWRNGGWETLFSTNASVGKNGVSNNYGEGKGYTPKGTFSLGFCYGLSRPNTGLRFKQLQPTDIFVSDSNSSYYNYLVPSSTLPKLK